MGGKRPWDAIVAKFGSVSRTRGNRVPRQVEPTPQPQHLSGGLAVVALLGSALLLSLWNGHAYRGNADLWREQSIYQVQLIPMPD